MCTHVKKIKKTHAWIYKIHICMQAFIKNNLFLFEKRFVFVDCLPKLPAICFSMRWN